MKKALWLAVLLSMIAPATQAGESWRLKLGLGTSILASNFNPDYSVGLGLDAGVGYAVNDNWSFWLTSTGYYLPSDSPNITSILNETLLAGRYTFSGAGVLPYLTAGFGTATQILSYLNTSVSSSDLMLQTGLGIEFPASPGFGFYVETKTGFILASGTTAIDIPINAGVLIGL